MDALVDNQVGLVPDTVVTAFKITSERLKARMYPVVLSQVVRTLK